MKFFLTFYRKLSGQILLLYVIAAILLILSFIITLTPIFNYIKIILILTLCAVFIPVTSLLMPVYPEYSGKDYLRHIMKAYFFYIALSYLSYIACTIAISLVVGVVVYSIFNNESYKIGYVIMNIIQCAFYIYIISRITVYNGFTDTGKKRFNPHLCLITILVSQICIVPVAYTDWVASANTPMIILPSIQSMPVLFIMGILLQIAVICGALTIFYFNGRKNFFKKHPNSLEYDKPELDNFMLYIQGKRNERK